jgi:hypothetical protein
MMRHGVRSTAVALIALQALIACSLAPDRSALVPATYAMRSRHPGSVTILVTGTDAVAMSDELFAQALEEAIKKSALFAQVVTRSEAAFRIEVVLQRLIRPGGGVTAEAQLSALWALRALNADRVVWQDLIVTSGSGTMSDALWAMSRARIAIERATNKNIQRAIQEMSLVDLN